jgi:hypothetical protein
MVTELYCPNYNVFASTPPPPPRTLEGVKDEIKGLFILAIKLEHSEIKIQVEIS